jgi:hypothetical protein
VAAKWQRAIYHSFNVNANSLLPEILEPCLTEYVAQLLYLLTQRILILSSSTTALPRHTEDTLLLPKALLEEDMHPLPKDLPEEDMHPLPKDLLEEGTRRLPKDRPEEEDMLPLTAGAGAVLADLEPLPLRGRRPGLIHSAFFLCFFLGFWVLILSML